MTARSRRPLRKIRTMKVWVDVGSHGKPFFFDGGPVAESYPNLMQVYGKPSKGLTEAVLTYAFEKIVRRDTSVKSGRRN